MNTTNPPEFTYDCVDCFSAFPRSNFGSSKKRNPRCDSDANGCSAKYRKKLRLDKKKPPSQAITVEALLLELDEGPSSLKHMSKDEQKQRRASQNKMHSMIRDLPSNVRELYELERVLEIEAKYDYNPSRSANAGFILSRRYANMSGGRYSHITATRCFEKRIFWLKERIAFFDPLIIERAHMKEIEKMTCPAYDPASNHSNLDNTSLTDRQIARIELPTYRRLKVLRDIEELRDRTMTDLRPTAEELAEYMKKNWWFVDDTAYLAQNYRGDNPLSDGGASQGLAIAERMGDTRSASKYRRRTEDSDAAVQEFESEFPGYVYKATLAKYEAMETIPTWSELLPKVFTVAAIDGRYSPVVVESKFDAQQWQEYRWVTLSDKDLVNLESAAKTGGITGENESIGDSNTLRDRRYVDPYSRGEPLFVEPSQDVKSIKFAVD